MINANKMSDGLWVGNHYSSRDCKFIKDNKITVIINASKDLPFSNCPYIKYRIRVPIHDNLQKSEINNMTMMYCVSWQFC